MSEEQKDAMVPARAEHALAAPIQVGNTSIATKEQLDAVLDGTMGKSSSVLDGFDIYRQGKEDYFKIGDRKVGSFLAIFLLSRRPMRAFWEKDELSDASPDCHSMDGVTPSPDASKRQSPTCEACSWSKAGSGKGRGQKCKTKAADFVLVVPEATEKSPDNAIWWPDPRRLTPGVVMYSIANAGAARSYSDWQRVLREKNLRAQGVVTRWKFGTDESKSGVEYNYVEQEFVAAIPPPDQDSDIWKTILTSLTSLKGGAANEILTMLSGSNKAADTI